MPQTVKSLPAVRETQVRSLCQEDPLEKEMAAHSSTLAWRTLWTEEPGRLRSMGSQRVGHDWATSLSLSFNTKEKVKTKQKKSKETLQKHKGWKGISLAPPSAHVKIQVPCAFPLSSSSNPSNLWKEKEMPDPVSIISPSPSLLPFFDGQEGWAESQNYCWYWGEVWLILKFSPPWQVEVWSEI